MAGAVERDIYSANMMLPLCKKSIGEAAQANIADAGYCAGLTDMLASLGRRADESMGCWDTPPHSTIGQRVTVVVRYIEARPARMHEPYIDLAIEALRNAWPCK
jgi:Rap1a immunity proteins